MDNWIEAGKIAAKAREYGKKLIKVDVALLDVVTKVEDKIIELGGKLAFPVDLSINHIAAHASPKINDETRFKKGDLVKLDLGVHIEGCIADTACSIGVGTKEHNKLIEAAEEALNAAMRIIKPGVEFCEIGRAIQEKIQNYGFSPVKNLCGHEIQKYFLHAGARIPNYDDGNKGKVKEGMIFAIEPFATNGVGMIKEGKPSGIYQFVRKKAVRDLNVRNVLEHIEREYKSLPFAARWLKFSNLNFALNLLEREGIIQQYNQLPEKSSGLVSQAEHTLEVGGKIFTL